MGKQENQTDHKGRDADPQQDIQAAAAFDIRICPLWNFVEFIQLPFLSHVLIDTGTSIIPIAPPD